MTRAEELEAIERFRIAGKIKRIEDPVEIELHNTRTNQNIFEKQSARGRRAARTRQRTTPTGRKRKASAVESPASLASY